MTEYRRYQGKSYMICREREEVRGYEYPMLTGNRIRGILPLSIVSAEGDMEFWYEISGKNSLEEWVKIHKVGVDFLRKFMKALFLTLEHLGEYLLEDDGISLLPEHIYLNADEKEIEFCYMPFHKTGFIKSLQSFMEYYLSHMEHGEGEDIHRCYSVYEKCQEEFASPEEILQILYEGIEFEDEREEQENRNELPKEEAQEAEAYHFSEKWQIRAALNRAESLWNRKNMLFKKKKNMDTEYVFEPGEEPLEEAKFTVFLGSETDRLLGELRYEGDGDGKNIKITSQMFLVGSREEEVDGWICDETISRIHAKITREGEDYYIEDLNSTNGTFCNGEILNYKERRQLQKNDEVIFAKEKYRFV